MADNVSSNVLFHFTKSFEALKSILKNGFWPRYCPEYTLDPEDIRAAAEMRPPLRASPMVCFCDLPLSLIHDHLKKYGCCGIGLGKQWGFKNGLAPVIYTHHGATTCQPILRLTEEAAKGNDGAHDDNSTLLAAYTKVFSGPAWRNGRVEAGVQFYDEREWRYVPASRAGVPLFLNRQDYTNTAKKKRLHQKLMRQNRLMITPADIQYLIVPYDEAEEEIYQLHKFLKKLYSPRDAILVTTAIMTDDRIHDDI